MPSPDPGAILADLERATSELRDTPTPALCEQRLRAIESLMPLVGSFNHEQAIRLREAVRQGRRIMRTLAEKRAVCMEKLAKSAAELRLVDELRAQARSSLGRSIDLRG